jgi:hypothetical protein
MIDAFLMIQRLNGLERHFLEIGTVLSLCHEGLPRILVESFPLMIA